MRRKRTGKQRNFIVGVTRADLWTTETSLAEVFCTLCKRYYAEWADHNEEHCSNRIEK